MADHPAGKASRDALQPRGRGVGAESEHSYIAMIEDISISIEIVEALRRQHHSHIFAPIKEWHSPQEEVITRNLHLPWLHLLKCLIQEHKIINHPGFADSSGWNGPYSFMAFLRVLST